MSRIIDPEKGINGNLPTGKYIGIYTTVSERDPTNLHHPSKEAGDLLKRLNELANGYPFNIIYKAKVNDPR